MASDGHCMNFCSWKRIQFARSPVSPSGTRRRPDGIRDAISRITVSLSARLTLPLKCAWAGGMEGSPQAAFLEYLPRLPAVSAKDTVGSRAGTRGLRSCQSGLQADRQQQVADRLPGPRRGLAGGERLGQVGAAIATADGQDDDGGQRVVETEPGADEIGRAPCR